MSPILRQHNGRLRPPQNPALMATKTSILIFYLTLTKAQKVFKWTTIGTMVVVNAAGFALSCLNIFQCRPLSTLFMDPKPDYAHCTEIVSLYLSSSPVNIITDLVILLLPMPVLKSMHLPQKQKIILYITFGFGVFVTVVDIVRISYLQQASETRLREMIAGSHSSSSSKNEEMQDFSYYAAYTFMWSAIEVNVGICCASVPALKPLVSRFAPNMIKDAIKSSPGKKYGSKTSMEDSQGSTMKHPVSPTTDGGANGNGSDEFYHHDFAGCDFLTTPETAQVRSSANLQRAETAMTSGEIDFLTSPGIDQMSHSPNIQRTDTAMTNTTVDTRRDSKAFFDFMNIYDTKPITQMTNKESIRPIALVTVLFVIWGFAYGLLNTLNGQIQAVIGETTSQATGTHAAYYVGYFVAPLTFALWILKHWGFKACYMIGLIIYGTGTLIFWPVSVTASFPGFLVCNFIIGMGLSTLEIAANPFIALCGPPEHAEMRLNLSQGFQAVGTVISHILAKKAFFKDINDPSSLTDSQWTYLAISLFTFILCYIYYIIKLPEVSDGELDAASAITSPDSYPNLAQTLTLPKTTSNLRSLNTPTVILPLLSLTLAALSQFCYVGAQESLATSIEPYISLVSPTANSVNYEAIGQAVFAVSRFFAAGSGFYFRISPLWQLIYSYAGCILFSALAMVRKIQGVDAGAMVMCIFFFEGPIFALVFAMPLRGLGRRVREASAVLTAAVCGGAIFPGILNRIALSRVAPSSSASSSGSGSLGNMGGSGNAAAGKGDYQFAYCVVVAAFAGGAIYPGFVVFLRARARWRRMGGAGGGDESVRKSSSR